MAVLAVASKNMKHIITGLLLLLVSAVGWGESIYQYDCTFPQFSDENEAKQKQKNDYTGVDIVTLKTLMNHASIQQTSEYVANNDEMLKKAVMLA